jgi:MATE family multidrug resistance protein
MIFQSYKQFAEGLSRTRLAMIVIFATNIVNIGLNYVFIYGHAGIPAMGLTGAGWATLISRFMMMAMIILYIYYSPTFHPVSCTIQLRSVYS